ncbi:PREDICTED: interleukin-12 subunit alpha, partial [Eurypyga helias]|uniref:interleukin-12 subunit alpha n=1 Tax=Eurypyga helias TaxID=54383 RepID=UPI000528B848
ELGTLGFECTLEEVDLEDITENQINTIKACTSEDPGTSSCPALERSTFDMSKCLQGIYEDLSAYRAELKNFDDQKVLATIDGMMKALKSSSRSVPQASAGVGFTSFQERMRLCSILQGFRIRTITINRMMNYLTSLESSLTGSNETKVGGSVGLPRTGIPSRDAGIRHAVIAPESLTCA